ncbi:Por secretion system C-terminal sorting domain-containing protein [Dyadobacter soli]|uniref:Por secretion system C-terminal sorting domain-containing protein n=1 Tax=Dyadobacter soli TaxID=659014 RepID=A0A1G6XNL7_9BACT|nr:sialate O-acetylesterase [Dyadobacter soli]SDD79784.1 Por secretion system C-terminal sorting domain-containing protein [Dyadobacter soli]
MLKTLLPGGLLKRAATHFLLSSILTLLAVTYGTGQHFNPVYFSKLPQDYQLYPRDAASQAKVPVAGVVDAPDWKYVSVQVLRNGQPYQYRRAGIQYGGNGNGTFSAEAIIKAERANYDFKISLCKHSDSTLLVTRTRVVSGDVYILSGQSNATGFFGEGDTSMFCRTFGKITGNLNNDHYKAADTLWALSNMHPYDNGVGTMGFEIQKQLMEKSGVPNCLINAGYHWSSAYSHSMRTENNPADFTNGYGRMLYRARKAGVTHAVKAYIFRQGESEAYGEGGNWEGYFDVLYKNLKTDFPAIEKLYVCQIDIIYHVALIGTLIRDHQRRLPDIHPDITSIATVGTTGFDGLHYSREGNKQSGAELSRLMLRDFYASTDTDNIDSPNLRKAFYNSAEKNSLTLVFDEGQALKYPEPYRHPSGPLLDLKDFFYLDYQAGPVSSGKAEGNRIILDLKSPQNAKTINYLPPYLEKESHYYPFTGPYITNARGMRAFTFHEVPIATALPGTVLAAQSGENGNVRLSWQPVDGAKGYLLERKFGEDANFTPVARVGEGIIEWQDEPGESAVPVIYRLVALNEVAESANPAYAEVAPTLILGTEKEPDAVFELFPNPAQRGDEVTVKFTRPQTGKISLVGVNGQFLIHRKISMSPRSYFTVPRQASGMHLIRFESDGRVVTKKLWIR